MLNDSKSDDSKSDDSKSDDSKSDDSKSNSIRPHDSSSSDSSSSDSSSSDSRLCERDSHKSRSSDPRLCERDSHKSRSHGIILSDFLKQSHNNITQISQITHIDSQLIKGIINTPRYSAYTLLKNKKNLKILSDKYILSNSTSFDHPISRTNKNKLQKLYSGINFKKRARPWQ